MENKGCLYDIQNYMDLSKDGHFEVMKSKSPLLIRHFLLEYKILQGGSTEIFPIIFLNAFPKRSILLVSFFVLFFVVSSSE